MKATELIEKLKNIVDENQKDFEIIIRNNSLINDTYISYMGVDNNNLYIHCSIL